MYICIIILYASDDLVTTHNTSFLQSKKYGLLLKLIFCINPFQHIIYSRSAYFKDRNGLRRDLCEMCPLHPSCNTYGIVMESSMVDHVHLFRGLLFSYGDPMEDGCVMTLNKWNG